MRTEIAQQEKTTNFLHQTPGFMALDAPSVRSADSGVEAAGVTESSFGEALVLEHLPMVRFIARRIYERLPQHIDMDDLVSAGMIGLLDAASKYDSTKQVQFKSYAQFRIRGAILDSLRVLDWSPRELRRKGREIAESIRILSARLGRTPVDAEIAEEMRLPLVNFHQITGELKGLDLGSLDVEHNDETGDAGINFVAAPSSENPLNLCIEHQTREQLAAAIQTLPEKERLVLTLSYYEGMTLKEIGLTLGVVESRASQIRSSALRRIRKALIQRAAPSIQN